MAYSLTYSLGIITVADTTINSQTSLNLPGRNYAGYGQPVDQNQLSILENFASYPVLGPSNPIPGQTWFDTNSGNFNVNLSLTSTPDWTSVAINDGTSDVDVGNARVNGTLTTDDITTGSATTPGSMTGAWAMTAGSSFYSPTITTPNITTGSPTTPGTITGAWSMTTGSSLNMGTSRLTSVDISTGTSVTPGVMTGAWSLAPGSSFNMGISPLTLTNITTGSPTTPGSMTGAWAMTAGSSFYSPTLSTASLNSPILTTGASAAAGAITGQWTLTPGSTLNATYADYAERFWADDEYEAGTVMEMGGEREITAARTELSEEILGVVSITAGMTMNSAAGTQKTHPAIAMAGRVPVKVRGIVRKGNRLVSAGGGYARAALAGEATSFNTVGRSLEDKLTEGEGKVLAAVSAKL